MGLCRQIGILRDGGDREMDNFPSHPYSPSSNYTYVSSSAGPDFSGLFSVARDLYQRQVLILSAVFVLLWMWILFIK